MKACGLIGSLDDLDLPFAMLGERLGQLVSGVATIGEDMAQPWEQVADRGEQLWRSIPILNVGGMDPVLPRDVLRYR